MAGPLLQNMQDAPIFSLEDGGRRIHDTDMIVPNKISL
jgi:hypothetical protein